MSQAVHEPPRPGSNRMAQTLERDSARTTGEVVSVDHLRVRYGDTLAVDDVSLSINRGEIFGILGPNGAGKTTTVEAIGGLRRPDAGQISVLGLDRQGRSDELRRGSGSSCRPPSCRTSCSVGEAMELFASFYQDP